MLRIENLSKQMPGFRLEARFQIQPGERIALVGRSGGGKTTLLRVLAGLEPLSPRSDSGRILLNGRDITACPVQKRRVGFVFQEQALFAGRSVRENLVFGLRMQRTRSDDRERQVAEWLAKLGLQNRGDEKVDHLSGGERQRVALARALIVRPEFLLMDEPFVGLDSSLRESLIQEVLRLCTEVGAENPIPLVFVSHDSADLAQLATGKIVLEEADGGSVRRFWR